ncbi:MAG: YkgJ family cysteine cluster protein [Gammaproteobacteria bacterium]|jgi:Fe-S-cluster containining protein|nr:YkgJ family cysteine cluster protein [Gammaproteobacteria bacterium]
MSDEKPVNEPLEYEGAEDIFEGKFSDIPFESPVRPAQLGLDDEFQFSCHPGISCFNECCRNIDIQLLPYDILRLKNRRETTSYDFVARYTLPFQMDHHGMPGLKLRTKPDTRECVFLSEEGCTVYADRPTACRYYALGSMGVRKKDSPVVEDMYFVVREPHCKGHEEPKTQTVKEYRKEQGVDKYDVMNREWRDIILKKRSSGPTVGAPSARSLQLYDMCSYDMDKFREFIQTPGFIEIFDADAIGMDKLLEDEEALLAFAMRFLKQVLFGEMTIPQREGAREERLEKRRARIQERREDEADAEHVSSAVYDMPAEGDEEPKKD